MKIQTCIQHHRTDNDIVYIGIDAYTFVCWMMPIMLSYLVYIRFLNKILLRPIMMSCNDESSSPLLLSNNWIIGCHVFHNNINFSRADIWNPAKYDDYLSF